MVTYGASESNLLQYALELNPHSGNTPCKGKSFKIPMLFAPYRAFIFTRQIPPSHRSKGNPWRRTHCGHELSLRDIPPSAVLSALSAPPSARGFGCPSACHPWKARRCSILRCSRCCAPYSGRQLPPLICPRGCCLHDKSRNDNRCRKSHAHGAPRILGRIYFSLLKCKNSYSKWRGKLIHIKIKIAKTCQ